MKEKEIAAIEEKVNQERDNLHRHLNGAKTDLLSKRDSLNYCDEKLSDIEKLPLETFSGRENYFYWKSIFDVCIDKKSVNKQTKMLRLLSCLRGEPKQLLSSYTSTGESYEAALGRLDAEYGGAERLLRKTISRVRDGKLIHGNNLFELREFLSIIESAVINMKLQDGDPDRGALYQCAKDRLHSNFLKQFLRWTTNNNLKDNFLTLRLFLEQEIRVMSEVNTRSQDENSKFDNRSKKMCAYFAQEQRGSQIGPKEKQKPFCVLHSSTQERHYLDECSQFQQMTVADRMKVCDKEKLCRLCLKRNHIAKNCRSRQNKSCMETGCNKMHHSLLHRGENVTEFNSVTPAESQIMLSQESQGGYVA